MGLSNLPPGVTDSMIPGNRPEDSPYEKWCDDLELMLKTAEIECNGDQFDVLANAIWNRLAGS